jgi:hypothetical protein
MFRRIFLSVAVLAALASCSNSSGTKDATNAAETPKYSEVIKDLTSGSTVLVVGTSVMQQFGEALKEALEPSGISVINEARPMTYAYGDETPIGSLKTDFQKHVDSSKPDLVLVQATFAIPVFNCSGTPEETAFCRKEGSTKAASMLLPDMIDVLSSTGASVVWVSFPATLQGLNKANLETSLVLDVANDAVLRRSVSDGDIIYSRAADLLGTDKENIKLFTKVDGGYRQLRGPDGIHTCQYGTQLVIERLADDIYPAWREKASLWPDGPWRRGESYTMSRHPWNKVVCSDEVVPEPVIYKAP